jgi:hypothetical protein
VSNAAEGVRLVGQRKRPDADGDQHDDLQQVEQGDGEQNAGALALAMLPL